MNILYTSCRSDVLGGGQKSLLLQLAHLARVRYTPFLLCPGDEGLAQSAIKFGVAVHMRPIPPAARMSIATVAWLAALLRDRHIQLVHTDSPRETLYAGLASKMRRIPLIWQARVFTPEPHPYERLLYALSDAVIAVSAAVARRFAKFPRSARRVHVIYNAVDLAECQPFLSARRARKSCAESGPACVGILGAVAPHKGHDDFLRAAQMVLAKIPNTRFLIVGAGERAHLDYLQRLLRDLGIADAVSFLGYQDEPCRVLSQVDILVNASKIFGRQGGEGHSRVILEAMAMEVPVVATNVGGNPESVVDGVSGLLVPPGNPVELSNALLRLCADPHERDSMGTLGRKRVEKYFNVHSQMACVHKLYELVLAQRTNKKERETAPLRV